MLVLPWALQGLQWWRLENPGVLPPAQPHILSSPTLLHPFSFPAQLERVRSPRAEPVSLNSIQSSLLPGERSPGAKAVLFQGRVPELPASPDLAVPQHPGPLPGPFQG